MIERNCNRCKHGFLNKCKELKNNKEFLKLFSDKDFSLLKTFEFKQNHVCDDYNSMYIEYPIEVSKINSDTEMFTLDKDKVGKFVKIRPCADEYDNKTFLGLYLGYLPISNSISYNSTNKELNVGFLANPAIFVFDLNKIIYGRESWWGIIENEEDLKEITDLDIENIWYVKALRSLT